MLTGADRDEDFMAEENETPEALIWIGLGEAPSRDEVLAMMAGADSAGTANSLSACVYSGRLGSARVAGRLNRI